MEAINLLAPEGGARVLVMGSTQHGMALLGAMLTVAGYQVEALWDGPAAMRRAQQKPPDLALVEGTLLDLSGLEFCACLKAHPSTRAVPVLLLLPGADGEHRLRGLRAGVDDVVAWPADRRELLARVEALIRARRHCLDLSGEDALLALARAVEARDPYTSGHMERVARLALRLGEEMGLEADQLQAIHKGGLLHDVGKVGVRDSVLLKKGPLTPEEFEQMKAHTLIGDAICRPLHHSSISILVRHHHERFDGRGYPDGLAGQEIPPQARLLALADAYDALTSDRPHRHRLTPEQARDILRQEAGRQFDPEVVSAFLRLREPWA